MYVFNFFLIFYTCVCFIPTDIEPERRVGEERAQDWSNKTVSSLTCHRGVVVHPNVKPRLLPWSYDEDRGLISMIATKWSKWIFTMRRLSLGCDGDMGHFHQAGRGVRGFLL